MQAKFSYVRAKSHNDFLSLPMFPQQMLLPLLNGIIGDCFWNKKYEVNGGFLSLETS